MSAADYAAWTSAGISAAALLIAGFAAGSSRKAARWQQDSAESARRSAEAAERANLLTERVLAGEGSRPPAADEEVAWELDRPNANRFVLRNTGTAIAEHVSIDGSQIKSIARGLPTDAVIRPGEGVDFMMVGTFGSPLPNQVYVEWGDPDNPTRVALPVK